MDALLARRRFLLIASFAAVWIVWGSTYLAIAIGIESSTSGMKIFLFGSRPR